SDSGTNKKASKQISVRDKKISTAKRRIVWNSHLSENKVGVKAASIKDNFLKNKKTPPETSHKSLTEEQKALLKKSTPSGYSISMPTLNQKKIEHNKRRIEWPSWIPILFKPPAYMDLDDLDIKMATYVLAPNKRSDEVLATTNKFSGTRDNFKSLIPKEWVHGDVLDLVATMLTMQEKEIGCQTHWYLPAVFS
ncbi:hypothetical protein S245_052621, partial [Arachis hypogaea]